VKNYRATALIILLGCQAFSLSAGQFLRSARRGYTAAKTAMQSFKTTVVPQAKTAFSNTKQKFNAYKNDPEIYNATLDFMLPSALGYGLLTYYWSGEAERMRRNIARHEEQETMARQLLEDRIAYLKGQAELAGTLAGLTSKREEYIREMEKLKATLESQ